MRAAKEPLKATPRSRRLLILSALLLSHGLLFVLGYEWARTFCGLEHRGSSLLPAGYDLATLTARAEAATSGQAAPAPTPRPSPSPPPPPPSPPPPAAAAAVRAARPAARVEEESSAVDEAVIPIGSLPDVLRPDPNALARASAARLAAAEARNAAAAAAKAQAAAKAEAEAAAARAAAAAAEAEAEAEAALAAPAQAAPAAAAAEMTLEDYLAPDAVEGLAPLLRAGGARPEGVGAGEAEQELAPLSGAQSAAVRAAEEAVILESADEDELDDPSLTRPEGAGGPPATPAAAAAASVGAVLELGSGGDEASWLTGLAAVVVDKVVVYTWTSFYMRDFLLSFLVNLKRHGITSFVIGAMDGEIVAWLRDQAPLLGITIPVLTLNAGLHLGDYGWNSPAFKRMAKYKFQSVQQMQSVGYDVVVADTDTAWLRNPLPEFARLSEADILCSTDVLRRMPLREQFHSTLNIGVMFFRARPGAIAFVTAFYEEMVADPAFGTNNAEWDQARFNRMVREGLDRSQGAGKDWHAGWGGRVKVQALDIVDFPNGHVYFAQRLPQTLGREPFVVHATFQYGGTPGKKHRFREWRAWHADPPEYYDPPGGLLSFTPAPPHPQALARANGSIEAHFELMNPQLSALRSAWGLARALNRTLIMPTFTCGMDRVWFSHDGVFPGSDPLFTIPFFPCPMDHVLETEVMERRGLLPQIREYSLLQNEKMPAHTLDTAARVDWLAEGQSAAAAAAAAAAADAPLLLPRGIKADAARSALAPLADRKLISFQSMPGTGAGSAFGGFEDAAEEKAWRELLRWVGAHWCCVSAAEGAKRGFPNPPYQAWYDLQWDLGRHTDRFERVYDKWVIKLGP